MNNRSPSLPILTLAYGVLCVHIELDRQKVNSGFVEYQVITVKNRTCGVWQPYKFGESSIKISYTNVETVSDN